MLAYPSTGWHAVAYGCVLYCPSAVLVHASVCWYMIPQYMLAYPSVYQQMLAYPVYQDCSSSGYLGQGS